MFIYIFALFVVFLGIYILYNSFTFQIFIRKVRVKNKVLDEFVSKVRGTYVSSGYFSLSHKIIYEKEYISLSNRVKKEYGNCYNVVKFRTADANWELFFHLLKEGLKFSEIMTVRVFPNDIKIRSEGNIEKIHSRLNIFTNNQYLSRILEDSHMKNHLNFLLQSNGDMGLIAHNNIHFKTFTSGVSVEVNDILEIIKSINYIKNKVYVKGVMEY